MIPRSPARYISAASEMPQSTFSDFISAKLMPSGRFTPSRAFIAAVRKMAFELPRVSATGGAAPSALFAACAASATAVTLKEKIAHVFVATATTLLPALLAVGGMRRGEAAASLDLLTTGLVEKLVDNTPRVRDAAMGALLTVRAAMRNNIYMHIMRIVSCLRRCAH